MITITAFNNRTGNKETYDVTSRKAAECTKKMLKDQGYTNIRVKGGSVDIKKLRKSVPSTGAWNKFRI